VIELGVRARKDEFRRKLEKAIESGAFSPVVSPWHLIETASTKNVANAIELAVFLDWLKPTWLLERRNIQELDVQEDFWRFLKVDFPFQPRLTTRSAAIAALNGEKDAPKFNIPSRAFVEQWIKHPEQLAVLKRAYINNATALTGMSDVARTGRLTEEITRRADRELVRGLMPRVTPSGLDVGPESVQEYLGLVEVNRIPSLAIETAISDHEWTTEGGADPNTLIDKFHLISALPYVGEIVSNDKFFHRIFPVAQTTGHVKARLVKNDKLLGRF
jgi:hypothetical protein